MLARDAKRRFALEGILTADFGKGTVHLGVNYYRHTALTKRIRLLLARVRPENLARVHRRLWTLEVVAVDREAGSITYQLKLP